MPHGNPFDLEFEELLPAFSVINGQCTVKEGPAPTPFPDLAPTPSTHIRTDQDWSVAFKWRTDGGLNFLMSGNWELTVYLEKMGSGEFGLPGNVDTIAFVSSPNTYTNVFNFGAGTVPEGAYRIVTTVDMIGPTGYQGPISAVGEGPVLRFYEVAP